MYVNIRPLKLESTLFFTLFAKENKTDLHNISTSKSGFTKSFKTRHENRHLVSHTHFNNRVTGIKI